MIRTQWGRVSSLAYGRALPREAQQGGPSRVYGTNGPTGWTTATMGEGPVVVIGRKGAYRGVHLAEGPFWVIDTAFLLRPGPEVDPRWAYYSLKMADLNSMDAGSAIPSTRRQDFEALALALPPLPTQRAIAEILGALDNKIAANERVSQGSEALLTAEFSRARADGEAKLVLASDLVEFNPRSATPSKSEPVYVDMQKLPTSGSQIIDWSSRPAQGGARFMNGDTLVARITPCLENRKVGFVDFLEPGETAIGSTEFIVMRSRMGFASAFSFLLAVDEDFRSYAIQHMIGSSGRQRVGAADLAAYELRLPLQSPEFAALGERADAVFTLLAKQRDETRHLSTLRDTLLPHLMSGRIGIREAEERVEESL